MFEFLGDGRIDALSSWGIEMHFGIFNLQINHFYRKHLTISIVIFDITCASIHLGRYGIRLSHICIRMFKFEKTLFF